jgi:ElaB/YqjD/DUF883 family membrane-anchored ribosome-binding protein
MFNNAKKDSLNTAAEDMHDVAYTAGRTISGIYNTATNELGNASEVVTTKIRSNPVQSTVVALVVGFIAGAILRR